MTVGLNVQSAYLCTLAVSVKILLTGGSNISVYTGIDNQNSSCDFFKSKIERWPIETNVTDWNEFVIENKLHAKGCNISDFQSVCGVCERKLYFTELTLSSNTLRYIYELPCNCTSVRIIDLSDNNIVSLPANTFLFLPFVQSVNVSRNFINDIEEDAFCGLPLLQSLDLSDNELKSIKCNIFDGLDDLRELHLRRNRIMGFKENCFRGLSRLRVINLSDNRIHYLSKWTFVGLERLQRLYLNGNRFAVTQMEFLYPFVNLTLVDLSENLFTTLKERFCDNYFVSRILLKHSETLTAVLSGAFSRCSALRSLDLSSNKNLIFIDNKSIVETNYSELEKLNISNTGVSFVPNISDNTTVVYYSTNITNMDNKCREIHDITSHTISNNPCIIPPRIVSTLKEIYYVHVGSTLNLECFSVGVPWPNVTWLRNGNETVQTGYFLSLKVESLNFAGHYSCKAYVLSVYDYQHFQLHVLRIVNGIRFVATTTSVIIIALNTTITPSRHVILYRAYEQTFDYVSVPFKDYVSVVRIASLELDTEYEICVASVSDWNDKTCSRTRTSGAHAQGVHYDVLAVGTLSVFLLIAFVCLVFALYKCVDKIRLIVNHRRYLVGSEHHIWFEDMSETTFVYENHGSDLRIP
ncbi:hypothetical protein DPMN_145615 [Dreissena polymorpha]|uniref:Ig-like domain-containing protein n=1 Tax=Dreissena polymorpha TaxID=45954 RepID=A0A9D4J184_DREPO|nr:hypothetical protein DPMN_145615 [Dreissena polymorpha]